MSKLMETGTLLGVMDLELADILWLFDQSYGLLRRVSQGFFPLQSRTIVGLVHFDPADHNGCVFESAAVKLGASVIKTHRTSESEPIDPIVRELSACADVLVIGHPEIATISKVYSAPIILAGAESPPEGLTLVFTLFQAWEKEIEKKKIALIGDLARRGPAHSFLQLLPKFGIEEIYLCHPEGRGLPDSLRVKLGENVCFSRARDAREACERADASYFVRIPTTGVEDPRLYDRLYGHFLLCDDLAKLPGKIILHPHKYVRTGENPQELPYPTLKLGLRMALLDAALQKWH